MPIAAIRLLTAKTPRARREQAMNQGEEEIEQIAEQMVDAIKAHGEWVVSRFAGSSRSWRLRGDFSLHTDRWERFAACARR